MLSGAGDAVAPEGCCGFFDVTVFRCQNSDLGIAYRMSACSRFVGYVVAGIDEPANAESQTVGNQIDVFTGEHPIGKSRFGQYFCAFRF